MKPSACECKCKFPRLLWQMRYILQNPAKTVILVVLLSVALDIWVLVYECFRTRIYKGRIDGDSYYTYYVNLIRACKKVLYQLVYIGKKFVFLKEPLYLINQ